MKKLISMFALVCFVAVTGFSQDDAADSKPAPKEGKWHGYIVDAMCAKSIAKKSDPMERAARHTKECALMEACAAAGFGLFHDGMFYKFDAAGDKMAKSAIEKSKRESALMFDVTGAMEGDRITVASISEMKMEKMEMGKKVGSKKMEIKKEEHKH